jgi:hypothetical protein
MIIKTRHGAIPLLATCTLALGALTLMACRTNRLAEYMPSIKNVAVISVTLGEPQVWIGTSNHGHPLANAITDIATASIEQSLHRRVVKAAPAERLQEVMTAEFTVGLEKSFEFDVVSEDATHDTRIEIAVSEYGLYASSLKSEVIYRLKATSSVIFVPENRLIWETTESYSVPLTPVHLHGPGGRALTAGINLGALTQLSDEELAQTFDSLAAEGARQVLARMRRDARHR